MQELDGEAVLLDLNSEVYFGLDKTGCEFWKVLGAETSVENTWRMLCDRFDASPDTLATDLEAFILELLKLGLLQHVDS